jgi:hypothetical protein
MIPSISIAGPYCWWQKGVRDQEGYIWKNVVVEGYQVLKP